MSLHILYLSLQNHNTELEVHHGSQNQGRGKEKRSWPELSLALLRYFMLSGAAKITNIAQVESGVFPRTELISEVS